MSEEIWDCIIVGAGPAGLGAALYASRDRYKTILLEKFYPGGQINTTDRIENYPGYANISGPDLTEKMMAQATAFGAELHSGTGVTSLRRRDDGMIEVFCDKEKFVGRVVILAPGKLLSASGCSRRGGIPQCRRGRQLLRHLRCAVFQRQDRRCNRRRQYRRGRHAAPVQIRRQSHHGTPPAGISRHQSTGRRTDGQGQRTQFQSDP